MSAGEWATEEHALRYLARADGYPHRAEGEAVLLGQVPREARRILDLGTGDGRLLGLLLPDRPGLLGVGLDNSPPMLRAAHERFPEDRRITLLEHDLAEPLPALGRFDAVVSSFAIHHLEHERKRSLYGEVFDLLEPGGVFANFECGVADASIAPGVLRSDRRAARGRRSVRPPGRRRGPARVAARTGF